MKTIIKYYWIALIAAIMISAPIKAQQSTGKKQLDKEIKDEQKREKRRRSDAKAGEKAQEKGDEKPKYQSITKKRRFGLKRPEKRTDKKEFE
jgi:dsRNA-specific ribonuclease